MSRGTALWGAAVLAVVFTLVFGVVLLRPLYQAPAQAAAPALVDPSLPLVDSGSGLDVVPADLPQANEAVYQGDDHADAHEQHDDHEHDQHGEQHHDHD
ncbi:MAG TPA: hypothetical protein VFI42_05520 [Thermomicrobiaceae bacterium]|nr:hypothetical protein [Thermomicrobiaceae bacterium]